MHITEPTPLTSDLASVMRGLRVTVGFWRVRQGMSEALMAMVLLLLLRVCSRMERLEARFLAGTLRRFGPRVVVRKDLEVGREAAVRKERIWPYRFGWLLRSMGPFGYHGAGYGSQLRTILERPEVVELLIAAPQAGRVLRPLCRMLGVDRSVLRPRAAGSLAEVVVAKVPVEVVKRVRTPRPVVDWGRIPLPRGVLAEARRQGFGKVPP